MNFWRTIKIAAVFALVAGGLYVLLAGLGLWPGRSASVIAPASEDREADASSVGAVSGASLAGSAAIADLPQQKILANGGYHTFQSFNNCAPAALSIAFSYYGISRSQEALAAELRPYNNPQGVNDDKSTVPEELAAKAREHGLVPYYRVNGTIDRLRQLTAAGMPVIMRTLLHDYEDFAHYRVVKGYDHATREVIQDDSYQGKNLRYSYGDFLEIWQEFNYEYLVLARPDQVAAVEAILGEEVDAAAAWRNAVARAETELAANPNDVRARFNLSTSLYRVGEYERSVQEYEKIAAGLPEIKLWYQMQPIQAYFELGEHDQVLALTERILAKNVSYSELYLLRGEIFKARGQADLARAEFEKALFYNKNSEAAKAALASVS